MPFVPGAGFAPPPVQLLQMLMGMGLSRAISAAAQLGLADALVNGPRAVEQIAEQLDLHAESLRRLLRTLVGQGVFGRTADGLVQLTPLSRLLVSGAPGSLTDFARMMGDPGHWQAWGELSHTVRTGQYGLRQAMGKENHEYFDENPSEYETFENSMVGVTGMVHQLMVQQLDLGGVGHVVDVGGGNGSLLAALLERDPTMHGTLLERAEACRCAGPLLAERGLEQRVAMVCGDYGEQVPGEADLVLLKMVVHGLDDQDATALLRRCREALNPGGRLVVAEQMIPDAPGPHQTQIVDLNMMVMTAGGRERSEAEFIKLFSAAGFSGVKTTPLAPTPFWIIESEPA